MFRFHKPMDIITLFHKANSPASTRLVTLLKQTSAAAAEATGPRPEFKLEVTEEPPTTDQVQTILGYISTQKIPTVVKGATTAAEAMKKFRENSESFQRPVVVDWNNGKAHAGDNESEILKMLNALPK